MAQWIGNGLLCVGQAGEAHNEFQRAMKRGIAILLRMIADAQVRQGVR